MSRSHLSEIITDEDRSVQGLYRLIPLLLGFERLTYIYKALF